MKTVKLIVGVALILAGVIAWVLFGLLPPIAVPLGFFEATPYSLLKPLMWIGSGAVAFLIFRTLKAVFEYVTFGAGTPAERTPPKAKIQVIDKETFVLLEDYTYRWSVVTADGQALAYELTVPEGFHFDGASVPSLLGSLFGLERSGPHLEAAMVHDWIYRHRGRLPAGGNIFDLGGTTRPVLGPWTREKSDRLFLRMMGEAGYPADKRRLVYFTVRLYGAYAWYL